MELTLYNTLTRQKEVFRPADESNVRLYVCGPTVYDTAHIGNARTFLTFDLLFRVLRHKYGAEHVEYVRNITDIDDKINARAAERFPELPTNEAIRRLTEETNARFQADMTALGLLPPTRQPRATEHVAGMIAMIADLIQKGQAYAADGHVLFDVAAARGYGTLSRRTIDDMIAGARIEVAPYKRGPMDFVLWKPSSADQPGWESPWGRGRPGWHIECSVMSAEFLGETFDIHGGGIDLVFPHHENERAQSFAAHGCEMARVWMHGGFLQVEGEKMSKSLGNFVTVSELLSSTAFGGRSWPADAVRLTLLRTHYRQPLNFSVHALNESNAILTKWHSRLRQLTFDEANRSYYEQLDEKMPDVVSQTEAFFSAVYDDLNMPEAIAELHRLASDQSVSGLRSLYWALTRVGITSFDELVEQKSTGVQFERHMDTLRIEKQIEARTAAKKAKNFAEADRIRKELEDEGIVLKDSPTGTTWELRR